MLPREIIARWSRNIPHKMAYIDGESGKALTWREIDERSNYLAASMQKHGVGKGDAVAILAHDIIEVIEHFFACLKIGAWRVGINWRFSQDKMLHILRDSKAKLLFIDEHCARAEAKLLDQLAGSELKVVGIGKHHGLPLDFDALIHEGKDLPLFLPELDEDDVSAISYTTGTTGMPKGVLWTQKGVAECVLFTCLAIGLREDDIWFNPFPMPGVPILVGALNLGNGMTSVVPGGDFEAHKTLEFIGKYGITSGVFVPTQMKRVTEVAQQGHYDLSTFRLMVFGSSPAAPALIREAYSTFKCDFTQVYGLTEGTWGIVSCMGPKDIRYAVEKEPALLSSVGHPTIHVGVSIRNSDGTEVLPGEVGEIWISGNITMKGYWNMPKETQEAFRDGWMRTADIGRLDENGYLYLLDRKSFMIISGGYNVFPGTVEAVVAEHPAIREVSVIGAPHPEWGEAVVAFVSLRPGFVETPESILQWCKTQTEKLSKFEVPKHIIILEDLPRGVTGKLDKLILKDMLRKNPGMLPWNIQ